jgi:uncharacterized protein (DUF934 family)
MPLLKIKVQGMPSSEQAQIVTSDDWQFLGATDTVPATGDVVVPLARFVAERDALLGRQGKLGVQVEPTDELTELAPHVDKLAIIAINFPKFGDGRGYTHARLLRERHGFKGELRAVGEVLADQLFYMARVGFDAFALVEGKDVQAALRAFSDFSVTYQAAADDPRPLFRRVQRA